MLRFLLAVPVALALAAPAAAQVSGRAVVLSSDTLRINGQLFSLYGVDGVEFHQFCFVDGRDWACGAPATRALQTLLDPVLTSCTPTGGRDGAATIARCESPQGDLAEIQVAAGWAFADPAATDEYVAVEETARAAGNGVWRGTLVEPWFFREDMAAIEADYAELAIAALRTSAEAVVTTENPGLSVFEDFTISIGGAEAAQIDYEVDVAALSDGYIQDAIVERDAFRWEVVAAAMDEWHEIGVETIVRAAADAVWRELARRPGPTLDAETSQRHYSSMVSNAAPWIEAGRQPILLVASPAIPSWLNDWFTGSAPDGAEAMRKDTALPGYFGTIAGIDIFFGTAPEDEMLLFPADILQSVTYAPGPDGAVIEHGTDRPPYFVFSLAFALEWSDDEVFHFEIPEGELAILYEL